jgi:hypothetical protein
VAQLGADFHARCAQQLQAGAHVLQRQEGLHVPRQLLLPWTAAGRQQLHTVHHKRPQLVVEHKRRS